MPFRLIRNDIVHVKVDAIVNSANPKPIYERGTDWAVYQGAGKEKLLEARQKIGSIDVGEVAVTPAFELDAKYIFHTVGPVWADGNNKEEELLRDCYANCLSKAMEYDCKSIAFPLISAGSYGFPKERALQIALHAIQDFLMQENLNVYLVVYDEISYQISKKLFDDIDAYIDANYVVKHSPWDHHSIGGASSYMPQDAMHSFDATPRPASTASRMDADEVVKSTVHRSSRASGTGKKSIFAKRNKIAMPQKNEIVEKQSDEDACFSMAMPLEAAKPKAKERSLEELMGNVGETFQQMLLRLIAEKGMSNVEAYGRANMTKQTFYKIKNNPYYHPQKKTAFALAIALRLSLDETKDFLARAGYAFSPAKKQDIIVQYFIEREDYDIYTVDIVLEDYGEETLTNYADF